MQVRLLFKAMEQNEKVEYLDLGDNAISDVGISYVADLLQAHIERERCLLVLNLVTSTP